VDWEDYTLEVAITPLIGELHAANVRVQGAQRSYAAALAPDGTLALYRKSAGCYERVASVPFAWRHGERYTLRVTVRGARLTVEAAREGERAALDWTDPAPYLRGQIGLSTWHGSHTAYADLH